MTQQRNNISLFGGVDHVTVVLYLLLVFVGLMCVASAGYNDEIEGFFNFRQNHIKQAMWAGVAFVVGLVILLVDSRYYHMYAYYAYFGALIFTAGTIFAPEAIAPITKGAKAWYELGPVRIQPAEFAKIATALAVARMMSNYTYNIHRVGDLLRVAMIILLPFFIILMQNDTGSGVVLGSFIFVLYREGLNKWLCIPIIMVATLFIFSFLFTPLVLLSVLVLLFTLSSAMMLGGQWRKHIIFVAGIALGALTIYGLSAILFDGALSGYESLVIAVVVGIIVAAVYALRKHLVSMLLSLALFIGSMVFVSAADIVFESVLQPHQKERILSFLGIINDPAGIDFNVNQSKIAIGSGGLFGKGFMQGTQSKYFVPEKHTDFIFCTAGEEWGFFGSMVVLALLCALILRLMKMGERQQEPFNRIYCYSVAAIFLFHVMVNLGMTIGLMPVMGIPLPFMSYGGSSMIAFTILLFIAIRLDASPSRGIESMR